MPLLKRHTAASFSVRLLATLALVQCSLSLAAAQTGPPASPSTKSQASAPAAADPLIPLRATSTTNLSSELGAAFNPPVKCDADGNLYIRRFAINRPTGPVVKIDPDGKPAAIFAPAAFSDLRLDRIDAFSPAADGGIYQIAQSGIVKPRVYVLHYSSSGTPSSSTRLDADFEVYTFAAFIDGSFLVSGVQRDPMDKNDHGHGVTKVFSADGAELAQLTFPDPKPARKANASKTVSLPTVASAPAASSVVGSTSTAAASAPSQPAASEPTIGAVPEARPAPAPSNQTPASKPQSPDPPRPTAKPAGALDLKDAEVSRDGNLYVMRTSSQALIDVISPSGKILRTLKIAPPAKDAIPNSFHISENRLAILFWTPDEHHPAIVIADAQTGRRIAAYSYPEPPPPESTALPSSPSSPTTTPGPTLSIPGTFACYSANDSVFTFLKHGDGNVITVIRAEAQ